MATWTKEAGFIPTDETREELLNKLLWALLNPKAFKLEFRDVLVVLGVPVSEDPASELNIGSLHRALEKTLVTLKDPPPPAYLKVCKIPFDRFVSVYRTCMELPLAFKEEPVIQILHRTLEGEKLHNVPVFSKRLRPYLHGDRCCQCGVQATHVWAEAHRKEANHSIKVGKKVALHFNVYGTLPSGAEIMLTLDHVIPRSRKLDWVEEDYNHQILCAVCNSRKSNDIRLDLVVE